MRPQGHPGAFERPPPAEPVSTRPWEAGDEEPVEVRVLIDAGQVGWRSTVGDAPVDVLDDGSCVVTLRVTNRSGLRSWVLGFLEHAEVLSPQSERDALVRWLEALVSA